MATARTTDAWPTPAPPMRGPGTGTGGGNPNGRRGNRPPTVGA